MENILFSIKIFESLKDALGCSGTLGHSDSVSAWFSDYRFSDCQWIADSFVQIKWPAFLLIYVSVILPNASRCSRIRSHMNKWFWLDYIQYQYWKTNVPFDHKLDWQQSKLAVKYEWNKVNYSDELWNNPSRANPDYIWKDKHLPWP